MPASWSARAKRAPQPAATQAPETPRSGQAPPLLHRRPKAAVPKHEDGQPRWGDALWTSGQNVDGPRKRRGEKNVGVEQRAGPRAKMGVPSHWRPGLRPQQRAVRKVGPQGAQAGCTKEMAKQPVVLRAGRDQTRERRRSPKEKRRCVTNDVLHVGRLAPSPWCAGVSARALL